MIDRKKETQRRLFFAFYFILSVFCSGVRPHKAVEAAVYSAIAAEVAGYGRIGRRGCVR